MASSTITVQQAVVASVDTFKAVRRQLEQVQDPPQKNVDASNTLDQPDELDPATECECKKLIDEIRTWGKATAVELKTTHVDGFSKAQGRASRNACASQTSGRQSYLNVMSLR